MHAPFLSTRPTMDRRRFLRGSGAVLLGLPMFEAMSPTFGRRLSAAQAGQADAPQRLVTVCSMLGFHAPLLFPEKAGADYEPTPYLKLLEEHRRDVTVISGLSHPNQNGNNGHASEMTWLTSAFHPGLAGFKNTISLDQLIAERIGPQTRFPSLVLSAYGGRSISWSATGVNVPAESSPARLFSAMFLDGTRDQIAQEQRQLQRGRSILDAVSESSHQLQRELGRRDRDKFDEYLTSVRDLESRMQQMHEWTDRPKPRTKAAPPRDVVDKLDIPNRQRLMYDMIALALQSDSTRTVSFNVGGFSGVPTLSGVSQGWHDLSHHGQDPNKVEQLRIIEEAHFIELNRFLGTLKGMEENGRPLLDRTAVVFGSNLGNASSHDWRNLPIIVGGGRFRHGAYVAHDAKNNTPLANLFVALAQHMGQEIDRFGSSTAAGIHGLEFA